MANYVYADTNNDLDLYFETENLGQISASPVTVDYGDLTESPTNTLAATPLLAESDIDGDRGEIANETITPMGAVASMSSTTNEAFARTTYIGSGNISAYGASAPSLKRIWVGSGTLFEMGGGMERSSAFWVGSGGLTVAGTKEERVAGHYSDTLFVPFNTEDFGAGFATTSSFDVYGLIIDPLDQGIDDFGFTYNTTNVRGASGILPLTNGPNAQGNTYAQSRIYTASGSLFSASGVAEATVAQPVEDIALFSTSGSSVFRASFDWIGSGSTTLSGSGVDKHIVDYSIDSDLLLSDDNYGTLEPLHEGYLQNQRFILGQDPYFPTPDNGEISEPLSEGEDDYGSIVFGQRRRTVHDTQTVEAARGKFTLGERKETGLRYQTRTLATGVADLPINRYEWVGTGTIVGFRGEVSERYKPTFGQAGSGSLFAFSGAAESKTVDLPEFTTLYSYGGNAFPVLKLDHWTGSGSLFGFGGLVEAATFHYNISSTLPYSTEDYGAGFTTTSTEDIGLITEIQSGGEENWYYINHLGPATPFGTATLTNGPGAEFNTYARVRPFIASGSLFSASGVAEAVGSNPPEDTALASFSGAGVEKSIFREVFSGSLFTVGGGVERATFDYNLSSINLFTTEDRDLVTNSASTNEDSGSTTEGIPQGAVDFDHIVFTQDVYGTTGGLTWSLTRSLWTQEQIDEKLFINSGYVTPETGLVPVVGAEQTQEESGNVSYIPIFGQTGSGGLFAVGGAAEVSVVAESTVGLFSVSGSTTFSAVTDYVASGSLFTLNGCSESATFDYNDTTVVTFTTDDQGLITASGSIVDHGSVTNPLTSGIQNNGTVIHTSTVNAATGSYTFGDTATEKNIVREVFGGSLFAVGGAVEIAGVAEESTGLFSTSGSSVFRVTNDWVGSGSLFTLNGCAESATWDYNETTVVTFTTDDQGLITASGSIVDHGSITNPLTSGIANHGTVIHTSTVNAVTGTYTFGSTSTEKNIVREVFGGSLFAFSGAVEAATFDDPDSTLLTTISGTGVEKSIFSEVFNGSLFSMGGGVERVAFDYNLSSIVTYATPVDNGLVNSAVTATEDNGSITDPLTAGIENLGNIIYSQTVEGTTGGVTFSLRRPSWTQAEIDEKLFINPDYVTPETGLVPVVGVEQTQEESADVQYIPIFGQIGSGSLFAVGGAAEVVGVAEESTGLFQLSTSAAGIGNTYRFCWNAPPVTGGLFAVNGAAESATWDYNDSTVVVFTSANNGLITNAVQTTANNGFITNPITAGIQNNGTVIHTSTVNSATGTLATGGSATDSQTDRYIGSGSISTFSGQALIEKAGVAEESTGLFSVSGSSVLRATADWVGSGSLFTFNGGVESATFDYNDTTVVTFTTDDQGLITATGSIVDYGSITNPTTAGQQNNGTVIHTSTVNALTGTLTTSGFAVERQADRWVGSGSISTFSGQALIEKAGVAEESTGLFSVSGSSVFRVINDWVGSGSLFTFNGGVEKVAFDYNDTTIVTFSTDDQGLITATGSIVDYGSITNQLTSGVQNNGTVIHTSTVNAATGLIDLTGDGDTARARPFIGSGSLFSASGAAEAVGVDEEFTGLFRLFTSAAGIGNTYRFCWNAPPVTGSLFSVGGGVEKVTFDYGADVVFTTDDYGSITASTNPSKDHFTNGLVAEPLSAGEEDYNTIIYNQTVQPYDGGTGPVFTYGYRRAPLTQEDIDLLLFVNPDYVTPETGIIPQVGDEATQEQSGDVKYEPAFAQTGSGSLFAVGGAVEAVAVVESTIGLFNVSGSTAFSRTRPFIGSGSIFTLNGAAESATWDYNESSIVVFTSADYGNVTGTPSTIADFFDDGSVTETTTDGEFSYGTVVNTSTVYPLTGSYVVSGDSVEKNIAREIGGGTLNTFSGQALVEKVTFAEEATTLYDFVGAAVPTRSRDFVGSGSLFTVVGGVEKVTWDYNLSSVVVFNTEDNGTISATTTVLEDNGLVTDPLTAGEQNNGTVILTAKTHPYGTIDLTGVAQTPRTKDFVGSGSLFTASGAVEVAVVDYESTYLFTLLGTTTFSKSNDYVGSGSLFSVGGCVEKVAFDYNDDTVLVYTSTDHGLVTDTVTAYADDGSISSPVTAGEENNGLVALPNRTLRATTGTIQLGLVRAPLTQEDIDLLLFVNPDYVTPETGLIPQVGDEATQEQSGDVKYEPTFAMVGSGGLFAVGGAAEAVAVVETGTGLFTLSTSQAGIGNTYRFCWKWDSFGTLPVIGGAAESATWDYSDTTVVTFTTDDQGLITATGSIVDYGSVTNPLTAGVQNNGTVIHTSTVNAATGTYTFGDAATEKNVVREFSSGSLFAVGGLVEVVAQTDDTFGLFSVSGSTVFRAVVDYVGSGSLFTLNGCAESRTYDYSDELLQPFTQVDNGIISAATTTADDNGSIILPTTAGEENNGSILNTTITPAEGTYTISGATVVVANSSYVGAGSLFTAGGLVEVVAQTDDTTGLFAISGVADTIRSRAYAGSGTLHALSGVAESRTWVYDRDLPTILTPEDYGSVDAPVTSYEDQGQVSNPLTTGEVDYGEDGTLEHLIDPAHGTYTISGVAETPFERRYIGSGSASFSGVAVERLARFGNVDGFGTYTLFTSAAFIGNTYRFAFKFVGSGNLPLFGGASESKTTNLPESTVIFTAAGTVTDSVTVREVFAGGSLSTFSGQSLIEKVTVAEEATGLFSTSGSTVLRITNDYVGSGSLFSASGAAEAVAVREEFTGLFTTSGTAVERQADRWVGSGSLFTANGAAESKTSNPPESTVLFTASGVGIEKHTECYVGTATPITLSGTSVERVAQGYLGDAAQYTLSGSATERESNAEVGSGSIFTASGAAESKTSNPPESTVIFVVGGSKAESFTPATEIGSGTLSTFSGQALIERVGVAEEATGLYTISGQVEFVYIVSYVGSGSLFSASGAAESKTSNPPESTILLTASGTGSESATVREVFAGGTLSTFSGQALVEKVTFAEEPTTLYTFSGAVEFIYRVRYPGSGTINLLSGVAESKTVDLPESTGLYRFSGSKDESFTPATEIGSGSYGGFSGTRVSEKHTEAYLADAPIYTVTGEGTVSQQYHWTGTGTLFTSNGAAESKTTNLPESTVIFTVAGSIGTAAVTKPFIGSGSHPGLLGTCSERVAQADEEGGTITISGDVVFTVHYQPSVGGNLFAVGGGAERVTFNPPEDTYLLVFGGSKAESFTPKGEVGSGSTTLSGTRVSEKHTERYIGDFAQFTYSGEATNVKFIPNWVGSGSIDLTGDGDTTRARDFVGSGSIFTASGSSESITTNPPESTVLFTAAGTSVERHTESYVGSGTATLSGKATNIRVIRFKIGSGSISTFSGAAESATIVETAIGLYGIGGFSTESFIANPPEDTAQYTFSGDSVEEQLDHYTGSGVMDFLEGGAATVFTEEKITFSPDGFGLFTFSGASTSAVKREYSGSGSILTASGQAIDEKVTFADDETLQIQLSGESVSRFTGIFVGSGSMFTAGGAAESKTTNQPESTVLFTFSGTAQTTRTRDFVGSGSISITGSTEERTLQTHVGSGSLFAVGGAAEAVAFADADTLIARFSGGANESFIRKGYQGTGSATLSGTSEEKHTERYVGDTAQYTISGGATEVRFIPHFNGSGSLFTAGGTAESKTTNKPESTVLFTFSGNGKDRFGNSTYVGNGNITLDGDATTEYRKFEVGFTFVTII